MCTYETEHVSMQGSAKGPSGWFDVTTATVYFDHPVHAPFVHSLNIDFLNAASRTVHAHRSGAQLRVGAAAGRGHPEDTRFRAERPRLNSPRVGDGY